MVISATGTKGEAASSQGMRASSIGIASGSVRGCTRNANRAPLGEVARHVDAQEVRPFRRRVRGEGGSGGRRTCRRRRRRRKASCSSSGPNGLRTSWRLIRRTISASRTRSAKGLGRREEPPMGDAVWKSRSPPRRARRTRGGRSGGSPACRRGCRHVEQLDRMPRHRLPRRARLLVAVGEADPGLESWGSAKTPERQLAGTVSRTRTPPGRSRAFGWASRRAGPCRAASAPWLRSPARPGRGPRLAGRTASPRCAATAFPMLACDIPIAPARLRPEPRLHGRAPRAVRWRTPVRARRSGTGAPDRSPGKGGRGRPRVGSRRGGQTARGWAGGAAVAGRPPGRGVHEACCAWRHGGPCRMS
jgi:hypothetical protein